MSIVITNLDIRAQAWARLFTREELREIARMHGITRGREKRDTAYNISNGIPFPFQSDSFLAVKNGPKRVVFQMNLSA